MAPGTWAEQCGGSQPRHHSPSSQDTSSCRYNPRDRAANCSAVWLVASGSETALEQAVAAVGPVSVAVDASSFYFHFYKSGTVLLFVAWMGKLRQGCLAAGGGLLSRIFPSRIGSSTLPLPGEDAMGAGPQLTPALLFPGIFSSVFCSQRVNHGMLAVGYGTSQESGRNVSYWILKNRQGLRVPPQTHHPFPCHAWLGHPCPWGAQGPVPLSLALPEHGNADMLIVCLFLQLVGGVG